MDEGREESERECGAPVIEGSIFGPWGRSLYGILGIRGRLIDYHGTDLSPPSSLFFFFLPLSFSLSFSAFLSPPLHLPPPHSPLSFSLSLSWPPYPRSFEPTPKFIPGGWYGDAPSSEWRQGIQRRREL